MTPSLDFEDYTVHPAAELFPLMDDAELDKLAADIKANGLQNPVIVHDGQILDGRNRYLACKRVGVMLLTDYYRGSKSPTAFVVSQNLHRRHLNESQRAMIGAGLMPMLEAEAKERQRAGAREKVPANLPEPGEARAKAAAAVKVSPRTIQDAITVKRDGSPEIVDAVLRGTVPVSRAAKTIRAAKPIRTSSPSDGGTHGRPKRWSVPWSIAELAATIRARRSARDIEELVALLSAALDARTYGGRGSPGPAEAEKGVSA